MRNLFVDDMYPAITKDSNEWKHLELIMDKHRDLQVTLFIIANNQEPNARYGNDKKYNIAMHPLWCKWIDSLMYNPRISIGYHGLRHWNEDLNNAEEFNIDSKALIEKKINTMLKLFDISFILAGKDKKIFKVPAHKCNPYLFNVLKRKGFEAVSFHKGENQTNELPVIETDGINVINSHIVLDSPTYIGRIRL